LLTELSLLRNENEDLRSQLNQQNEINEQFRATKEAEIKKN